MAEEITVSVTVNAPIEKVWEYFNVPEHIVIWGTARGGWHTPRAENDLRVGGKFNYRMEAEDGSSGFDFNGIYDEIVPNEKISYTIEGGRKVRIFFESTGDTTKITETFEAETENTLEVQRGGWQAILDNFKKHIESNI